MVQVKCTRKKGGVLRVKGKEGVTNKTGQRISPRREQNDGNYYKQQNAIFCANLFTFVRCPTETHGDHIRAEVSFMQFRACFKKSNLLVN